MKEILKSGTFLFLRLIAVAVMCLIVTVSIGMLAIAAFTENIGYTAYVTDKDNNEIAKYSYKFADGEDKLYDEYISKGYNVNKVNERSKLEGKGNILSNVLSQSISLIMLFAFIHNGLFKIGNSDCNLVRFKHKEEDKYKGLKIGFVSMIPYFVLFAVCLIFAFGVNKNMTVSILTLPMFYVFQILRAIIGNVTVLGDLSSWQFLLIFATLFIVPICAEVSYLLGYKDILIFEKLTYKKKK